MQPADYTARLVAGQRIDEESVEENAADETLDDGLRRDGANPISPVQAMAERPDELVIPPWLPRRLTLR